MRLLTSITLMLSLAAPLLAQSDSQPKAVPSRRLVTRGEMYHPLSEIYIDLEASAGKPGDMAAMRICSKEPLPVAMYVAVVNPVAIGWRLVEGVNGTRSFPPDSVMILRSPDCQVTDPPYVPVEFWGVPKGAPLPPSVESAKLCQINVEGAGPDEPVKSLRAFRAALRGILAKVNENSEAVVIVKGEYNLRPTASMRRALREAKRFFARSRLPGDRYFVRLKPSAFYDPEYPEPEARYPDVFAVQITKECGVESPYRKSASINRASGVNRRAFR